MQQFTNLTELINAFPDQESARIYLESQRWATGVFCPYCGHTGKIYVIRGGKKRMCGEPKCAKQFSVTVGTIFENTKLPLQKWFAAIYLMTAHRKGISSLQLSRDIGVTQKTAWFMLHRIRHMFNAKKEQLNGIVEIDETYVGGKEGNKHKSTHAKANKKGRSASKAPVLGIVQRNGNVVAMKLYKADHANVLPEIYKYVQPGIVIMTDAWPTYQRLDAHFDHFVIDHSNGDYGHGSIHTNTIEGFWSQLKRGIVGIYHYVSVRHLNKYCAEFAFRHNARKISDPDRFRKALPMAEGKRLKYTYLTAKWYVEN